MAKYCIHCGSPMEDDSAFCVKCGMMMAIASPMGKLHRGSEEEVRVVTTLEEVVPEGSDNTEALSE